MKISILCGNYYPSYSAVGLCASRLAEQFAKENEVSVLSVSDVLQGEQCFQHNGVSVYKQVPLFEQKRKDATQTKHKLGVVNKSISNYYRVMRMLKTVSSKYSVRKDYVNAFYQLLDNASDCDVVIALCMPIEAIYAAIKYRHDHKKGYKIIMMMYDGFADARTTHYFAWNRRLKFNTHITLEKKIFSQCDRICYVAQNSEHLMTYHQEYSERFVEVEHPNIIQKEEPSGSSGLFSDGCIHFVYGGGLKKDHIDPSYFIQLLPKLNNAKLDIFTSENALQQFKEFSNLNCVNMSGWLSQEKLACVLHDADFLINFATKDGHQISSKIFEFISMGRPFVHVYSSSTDNNLRYLKNYPLVLCINEHDDQEQNIEKLLAWCKTNRGKSISFDEILNHYLDCTPEYICKQMIEGM